MQECNSAKSMCDPTAREGEGEKERMNERKKGNEREERTTTQILIEGHSWTGRIGDPRQNVSNMNFTRDGQDTPTYFLISRCRLPWRSRVVDREHIRFLVFQFPQ